MPVLARAACPTSLMLLLLASCAGDESRHVFQSSPPARESSPAAASSPAAEPPVGANGPSARVTAVLSASTGTPVTLDQLDEDVDVVTLVSRGRASSAQGPDWLELRVTGSSDTTLIQQIATPVPVIVAHTFRLPIGHDAGGLRDGRYQLQVRLVGQAARRIAASVPVHVGVRAR